MCVFVSETECVCVCVCVCVHVTVSKCVCVINKMSFKTEYFSLLLLLFNVFMCSGKVQTCSE